MACNSPVYAYCTDGCADSTCTNCSPCNTCNVACNGKCQYCNTCQGACQSAQTFCLQNKETVSSLFGSFSFSYSPDVDAIIGPGYFDKDVWDEIASYISQRSDLSSFLENPAPYTYTGGGGTTNGNGGSSIRISYTADVAPFKATEFNRIASELNYTTVNKDDIITSTLFKGLEMAAGQAKISSDACPMCNTNCDDDCVTCEKCNASCQSTCNTCQGCVKCQGCDSCQGCNTCLYCEGCEDCNSCNACDSGEAEEEEEE